MLSRKQREIARQKRKQLIMRFYSLVLSIASLFVETRNMAEQRDAIKRKRHAIIDGQQSTKKSRVKAMKRLKIRDGELIIKMDDNKWHNLTKRLNKINDKIGGCDYDKVQRFSACHELFNRAIRKEGCYRCECYRCYITRKDFPVFPDLNYRCLIEISYTYNCKRFGKICGLLSMGQSGV